MTRAEAIRAMRLGKKVTHMYFTQEEFITIKREKIIDENNYDLGTVPEFFMSRSEETFKDGWSLYKNKSKNKVNYGNN